MFRVNPATRELQRADNGAIQTGDNYGSCMYRSPLTGTYYAFTASEAGQIEQYALRDEGGQVAGTLVRSWDIGGRTEGCVCDDETGAAYFGEERVGIWKIGAEPDDPVNGTLIASVGDASGLTEDVEGLAIYYAAGGGGYLIASSQGSSEYKVYDRRESHAYVKTFTIENTFDTDGIDVTNVNLGPAFPAGVFAAHSNIQGASKPVKVCAYEDLGLAIDTGYWNPRQTGSSPVILSFTPASGLPGTEVTVAGVRFTGVTDVTFAGVDAEFAIDSDAQLRATVPVGAGTGPIRVSGPHGAGVSPVGFVVPLAPTISSLVPASGPVGTEVTVTGTALSSVTVVEFNGIAATFVIDSNTQLRATVPAAATTGPIRVINPVGNAVSAANFTVIVPTSDLTFTPVHDTRVLSTSPTSGFGAVTLLRVRSVNPTYHTYLKFAVTGVSGTVERATLRLFCDDASVDGGEVYAVANNYLGTTTPWLESGLTWNNAPGITGSPLDEEGAVALGTWVEFDVTAAVTGNGSYSFGMTSGSTNIAGYSSKEGANPPQLVLALGTGSPPPLAITGFAPASGPVGTEVTVTGTALSSVTAVEFNGLAATFVIDSNTQLRATVPATATTGRVRVVNPGGSALSTVDFVVLHPPTISSLVPASGPVGTEVTVTGTAFLTVTAVEFNGIAATFVIDSNTQLRATVPATATTGPIRVINPAGNALSTVDFVVLQPSPAIAGFAPASGPVGTEVTVTGTEFLTVTGIEFNGIAATFVIDSNTQLRATVPAAATTGPIRVINPVGNAVSAAGFTVIVPTSDLTFTPVHDTRVLSTSPTSGFGAVTLLRVRSVNPTYHTYLKFAVTGVSGTVERATLRLFCDDASVDGGEVYAVANNYLGTTTPWLESGLTWNNAPGITGSPLDEEGAVALGTWVEFDVTAAVTGNGSYSFGMTSGSTNIAGYSSKEGANPPQLVLALGTGSPPPLAITGFAPASGPVGTEVTVTGTALSSVTAVEFNGLAATFVIDSNTQLRATVPASATTGPIRVINPAGNALSTIDFVVLQPPTITSLVPASGPVGTEVAVTGTEFLTVTAVEFNGIAATFVIDSNTQLRATVPAAATTGPIRVINPVGNAVSAAGFTVIVPTSDLTFTPVHDTRVLSTSPTSGFGAVTLLRVRSVNPTYHTYLKFAVTGVSGTVERATLRLFCDDASVDGGEVYAVANNYLGTTTPWLESGLTWNNAPGITGSPLDEEGAVALGAWVEFDVTAAVTGNGSYSFGMTSGSTNIAGYSSKEGANPPQLVIRTVSLLAAVPTASSSRPSGGAPAGSMSLGRPRPNPFSQQTSIRLDLSSALTVRATVYDIAGREVRSLGHRDLAPGTHELGWDGRDSGGNPARSGIYLLRLEAPGMTTTTRLVLSR